MMNHHPILFAFLHITLTAVVMCKDFVPKGPPYVTSDKTGHQKSVNVGKDVRLSCPISGYPMPIFEWSKGTEEIPEDAWDRYKVQGQNLKIRQIVPDDDSLYTCTGVNGFGTVHYSIRLEVLEPLGSDRKTYKNQPKIDQVFPVTGTVITKQAGQSVILKCQASGDPQPDITWFKNAKQVLESHLDLRSRLQITKYSLIVEKVTANDSGNYTCVAMNKYGATTANWTLQVIGLSATSIGGIYPLDVSDAVVEEGETAVLYCKGTWKSEVEPKVMWLRQVKLSDLSMLPDNETLRYRGKHYHVLKPSEFQIHDTYFLTKFVIDDVRQQDAGTYVCTATSKFAFNFRQATLSVIDSPSEYSPQYLVAGLSIGVIVILMITIAVAVRKKNRKTPCKPTVSDRTLLSASDRAVQIKLPIDQIGQPPRYIVHPHHQYPLNNQQPPVLYPTAATNGGRHSGNGDGGSIVKYSLNALPGPLPSSDISRQTQPILIYQDAKVTPAVFVASTSSIVNSQNSSHPVSGAVAPVDLKYQHLDVV